jgi:hypothetical protein
MIWYVARGKAAIDAPQAPIPSSDQERIEGGRSS